MPGLFLCSLIGTTFGRFRRGWTGPFVFPPEEVGRSMVETLRAVSAKELWDMQVRDGEGGRYDQRCGGQRI